MSRFLKTLAKVGLVELDGSELPASGAVEPGLDDARIARILEEDAHQGKGAPEAPSAGVAAEVTAVDLEHTVSFEQLYEQAQVPAATFSAEKLIKLLDGLKAMDPNTRKAAVLAMSAADDAWSIDDVLLDAERKCGVLRAAIERTAVIVNETSTTVQGELAAVDQYVEKATSTIRAQIADLEQLLQTEVEKAAERRAELQAKVRTAQQAAARESARYEHEIRRLREMATMFAAPPDGNSGTV